MENKSTWGAALWSILHHCTERIGMIPSNSAEEVKIWTLFLLHLHKNLPCIKCRTHYAAYYQKTGPPNITKEEVRRWLYNLHSDVNKRLGKPNLEYDELEPFYSQPFDFRKMKSIIKTQLEYNIRLKQITSSEMEKFLKELDHFRHFYHLI